MSDFEAVSELVSRTGVSYEEAKKAYEENGGNALEAAVSLEKKGRLPARTAPKKSGRGRRIFGRIISGVWKIISGALSFLCSNSLRVTSNSTRFSVPLIIFVIALPLCEILLPAMVVSLFFGVRYALTGASFSRDMEFGINRPERAGSADNGFFKS